MVRRGGAPRAAPRGEQPLSLPATRLPNSAGECLGGTPSGRHANRLRVDPESTFAGYLLRTLFGNAAARHHHGKTTDHHDVAAAWGALSLTPTGRRAC